MREALKDEPETTMSRPDGIVDLLIDKIPEIRQRPATPMPFLSISARKRSYTCTRNYAWL